MTKDELIEIGCAAFHFDACGPGIDPTRTPAQVWADMGVSAPQDRDAYRAGMRAALQAMAKATETERQERQRAAQQTADGDLRYWNAEAVHTYPL